MASRSGQLVGTMDLATSTAVALGDGSTDRASMITVQFTGTWTAGTATFQGTVDGGTSPTWVSVLATPSTTTTAAATATAVGIYRVDASGLSAVRILPPGSGTGTISVYVRPTIG